MALIVLPHVYRYRVTTPDGSESWEWSDVINDFENNDEINTGGGQLEVVLGRTLGTRTISIEPLLTEDDQELLTEDDQTLEVEFSEEVRTGDGTDLAIDNHLYVDEFYGRIDDLLTEDDEPLLTEADEPLLTEYGAPDGRRIFSGFISQVRVTQQHGRDAIAVTCLPFSADLEDQIFEVDLGSNINNVTGVVTASGVGAPDGTNREAMAQSFQATATGWLQQITLGVQFVDVASFPTATVTVRIYTNSTPGDPSAELVSSVTVTKDVTPLDGVGYGLIVNMPEDCLVTDTNFYYIEVTCPQARLADGTAALYVQSTANNYAPGAGYENIAGTWSVLSSNRDLYFHCFIRTTYSTRYTFTSEDPGITATRVVNKIAGNGSRIAVPYFNVEAGSISLTGFAAPEMPVNTNTGREVIELAVRSAPVGWYWRYGQDTRYIYYSPRPTKPAHMFVIGIHLKSVEVVEHIENMVNTVYFTGAETAGVTLYRKSWAPDSVARYGVKAQRITDGRVSNVTHADMIAEFEILSNIDPVYETQITVLDEVYDIATIKVGEVVGFTNGGDLIDSLQLQVMRTARRRGYVDLYLGARPRTDRRKLDEMRQALSNLEVKYNPSTPS